MASRSMVRVPVLMTCGFDSRGGGVKGKAGPARGPAAPCPGGRGSEPALDAARGAGDISPDAIHGGAAREDGNEGEGDQFAHDSACVRLLCSMWRCCQSRLLSHQTVGRK